MAAAARPGGRSASATRSAKTAKPPSRLSAKATSARAAKTSAALAAAKKASAKPATKAPAKAANRSTKPPITRAAAKGGARKSAAREPVPVAKALTASAAQAPGAKVSAPSKSPSLLAAVSGATEPVDPATLHLTAAPVLHRILTCHVPLTAVARLETNGESVFTAARHALQAGIRSLEQELQHEPGTGGRAAVTGDHERPGSRPVAVPAGLAAALLVTRLAEECFDGDVHRAGGWLVARGAGLPIPLPSSDRAATQRTLVGAIQRLAASKKGGKTRSNTSSSPTMIAPSGGRVSAPLILVPAGPQLRAMREALGVTREHVARLGGLTPGTVGEIERDRRPTAAARLQVAEVLCGLNPATRLES